MATAEKAAEKKAQADRKPSAPLTGRPSTDPSGPTGRLATWLAVGQLANCAWLVVPSIAPHGGLAWWLVPALAIAMGLPLLARVVRSIDGEPARVEEPAHA